MNTHFSPVIVDIRNANRLKPNYSELARSLGVTPQHVRRVFLGLSTSARVMKAIDAKVRQKAREREKEAKRAA